MASLCYNDEHLAWKQRLDREMFAASNFYQTFQSVKAPSYYRTRSQGRNVTPRKAESSPSKRATYLPELNTSNVFAEVRGKYCRAPILNSSPGKNGITVRPTTQGSLVSKRSHKRNSSTNDAGAQELPSRRSMPQEVSIKRPKPRKIEKKELQVKEPELKEHEPKEPEPKELEEIPNEAQELDNNDFQEDDQITVQSFKTTSSQRRYIEELENLLRQERMKRLTAEKKLKEISSKASSVRGE